MSTPDRYTAPDLQFFMPGPRQEHGGTTVPRRIPDTLTPCTPAQVFEAIGAAWLKKFNTSMPRASGLTLLSQWAEEDGIGRAIHCFNLGNAKCAPGGTHAWTYFECGETINGHDRHYFPDDPACCFRAFDTLEDGAADYLEMMYGRFHRAWPAVVAGYPGQFAKLLKAADYYTAPEPKYETALISLYHELDRMIPGGAGPEPALGAGWRWVQSTLNAFETNNHTVTFDELKVDGIAGPNTRAALAAFQASQTLQATQRADEPTVRALLVIADELGLAKS